MQLLIDSAFNRVPDELSGTRDPSQNQFCGYEFRSPLSFQISQSVILLSSPARERIKLENRAATIRTGVGEEREENFPSRARFRQKKE